MEDHSGSRGRGRTLAVIAGVTVALIAITVGAVVIWPSREPAAVAQPQPRPSLPPTPFEQAVNILDRQAAALLKGDERAWLAPVDRDRPALVARYRSIFRNLRGLGVSHAEFHASPRLDGNPGAVTANAAFGYCFNGVACPSWRSESGDGPPKMMQLLIFELINGKYTITVLADGLGAGSNRTQPAPWDGDELVFARGKRVTVAAAHSQAKHVKKVLAAAEKAAVVADRFAGRVGNPQKRYRVYLADDQAWKKWYGGDRPKWSIGYAVQLNSTGTDVLLRAGKALRTRRQLAFIIQHEFGHVVTLAGLTRSHTTGNKWLVEGIAEYIGAYPRAANNTGNWNILAAEFRREGAPTTIATESLADDADDRTVDRLYAMGHFAASCMADKYGERKLFAFVSRVLRQGDIPDRAARAAFGRSFDAVDKACLKWIKDNVT
jgi:hypothetical protein